MKEKKTIAEREKNSVVCTISSEQNTDLFKIKWNSGVHRLWIFFKNILANNIFV